jgi:glycosyltransferase involved in cell wall biosynthesis
VPLLEGGGSPLKFLEALAYGLPVVATPAAAAGLERLTAGSEFVLTGDTGASFAEGILQALEPEDAARLGAAGRVAVEREYSLAALTREFR